MLTTIGRNRSRFAVFVPAFVLSSVFAFGQTPQLVFTVPTPDATLAPAPQLSAVVEERGLALWSGTTADFGIETSLQSSHTALRAVTSMTTRTIDGRDRATFQQVELLRSVFSRGSFSIAGGAGIREEWDGARVLLGRVLAGSATMGGRLQGSLVIERVTSSPVKHDAADVITTVGWSRRMNDRIALGVETIGQDLEGLWNPAESDGGAKLLVGPSVHTQSPKSNWSASLTAGPVVQTFPVGSHPGGHHFAVFASANWYSRRNNTPQ